MSKPLTVETVDFSAGALIPYYDHDTRTVYLAGKVSNIVNMYEIFVERDENFRAMEIFGITKLMIKVNRTCIFFRNINHHHLNVVLVRE